MVTRVMVSSFPCSNGISYRIALHNPAIPPASTQCQLSNHRQTRLYPLGHATAHDVHIGETLFRQQQCRLCRLFVGTADNRHRLFKVIANLIQALLQVLYRDIHRFLDMSLFTDEVFRCTHIKYQQLLFGVDSLP